jgi:hypothetical protein
VIGVLREQDAWLNNPLMDSCAQREGLVDLLERARQEAAE